MALAVFLVAFGSSKAGFLKGSDSVIGVLFWIAFYLMYLQVEDLMELESSLFHQVATEVDTEVELRTADPAEVNPFWNFDSP